MEMRLFISDNDQSVMINVISLKEPGPLRNQVGWSMECDIVIGRNKIISYLCHMS